MFYDDALDTGDSVMAESNIVIRVENLGKVYQVYDKPEDRLKQSLYPRLCRFFGRPGKRYFQEYWALRDVSFSCSRGESVGVLGKNGAGKSTLLQLLAGTLYPATGSVELSGRVSALLELGSGFNPEYTGMQNIYFNGVLLGMSRQELDERIDSIIAFADIGDYLEQPVKSYSSGMMMRLAFSVMVHLKPELLIIDEALSVGDVFFQQKCNRFMRDELTDCTKIFVSHDLVAVSDFCERVLVLDKGRLIFDGPVKEGIEAYLKSEHGVVPGAEVTVSRQQFSGVQQAQPATEQVKLNPVDSNSLGGENAVSIDSFAVIIDGVECVRSSKVSGGQRVVIRALLKSTFDTERLIFGYLVSDKTGRHIFGDNSLSMGDPFAMESSGRMVVEIEIVWPTVAPGDYTLTLGIGEGDNPHNHKIQCWAHSVFAFTAVESSLSHGIFTNHITGITFSPAE